MNLLINYVLARAKERSTWIGLISAATALGFVLKPDLHEHIIATGVALAGLVAAITKDKP